MTTEVDTVTVGVKKAIIEQKLVMYRNTIYDVSLDIKIAKVIEDAAQKKAATARMKPLLKAIELLEAELKTLKPSEVKNE